MGKMLFETELQKCLDFCANVSNPVTPEQLLRNTQRIRIGKGLWAKGEAEAMEAQNGTVQKDNEATGIEPAGAAAADETERIVEARTKLMIKSQYTMNNFETEVLNGFTVRLVKGQLGMTKVQAIREVEMR